MIVARRPAAPVARLTSVVVPATRSRTTTSPTEFASSAVTFSASVSNAT